MTPLPPASEETADDRRQAGETPNSQLPTSGHLNTRKPERRKLPKGFLIFCPRRFCHAGVTEVTIADLQKDGVDTVILDLDNTLVEWQKHDVPADIRQWLRDLKAAGFKLCLLSNTRFGRRLKKLSEELEIPYVRRAAKPGKRGFRAALEMLGSEASKTVIIGDQMFTDVWGANRSGIYSVMVAPMARREFIGTKVSRVAERVLLTYFRRQGHI
jgi:HAD superfamily phosphatase (TIGR01668 family)